MGRLLKKFVYLTPAEQKILSLLPRGRAVSTRELRQAVKNVSPAYVSTLLGRLAAKKMVARVGKGVYLAGGAAAPFSEYAFGLALGGKSSYIAFSTAFSLHNLVSERPATIFVATPHSSKKILRRSSAEESVGTGASVEYKLVALGSQCFGAVPFKGSRAVRVSSVPKTFFDCFSHPRYAGGLGKLVEALEASRMSEGEWSEFLDYLNALGSNGLRQRVGFVVEKLCSRAVLNAPQGVSQGFLKALEKSVKRSKTVAVLDAAAPRKGFVDSKWRVLVNPNSVIAFSGVQGVQRR
ncbi:MAG: hypothetical protein V1817_04150 [Candidatus Micrarchaeota archaeon]